MRTITKEHAASVRSVARLYGATSVRIRRHTTWGDAVVVVMPTGVAAVYLLRPGEWMATSAWHTATARNPSVAFQELMGVRVP